MNRHEEARILHKHLMYCAYNNLNKKGKLGNSVLWNKDGTISTSKTLDEMHELDSYFTIAEQTEEALKLFWQSYNMLNEKYFEDKKELEELGRYVDRYFELDLKDYKTKNLSQTEINEWHDLREKLLGRNR